MMLLVAIDAASMKKKKMNLFAQLARLCRYAEAGEAVAVVINTGGWWPACSSHHHHCPRQVVMVAAGVGGVVLHCNGRC